MRPASELSDDIDHYREYIEGSRVELTVAKDQNVRLRSGWFSDRSVTYLAAGRPVVTQETGFSNVFLPDVGCSPSRRSTRPRRRSRRSTWTTQDTVSRRGTSREDSSPTTASKPILEHVGLSPASRRYGLLPAEAALPDDLVLTPASKRPLCLEAATVETVLGLPHPTPAIAPRLCSGRGARHR